MVATAEMLLYSDVTADGTPHLFAIDKSSGEEVGRVEVPAASRYGMSSWVHEGRQYVILQTGSSLTAMTLPE
jgi:quinoprotein glucose dehydrogenase